MARITVEDCSEEIDSQYDLVLLAKERTSQLSAGEKALVPQDNDKNTVLAFERLGRVRDFRLLVWRCPGFGPKQVLSNHCSVANQLLCCQIIVS